MKRACMAISCAAVFFSLPMAAIGQEGGNPTSQPSGETQSAKKPTPPVQGQPNRETPKSESAANDVRTPPQVSVDDVLREFQEDRPMAEPILPKASDDELIVRGSADAGDRSGPRLRLPDGYFLVDRVGWLMQDGPWWVFTFTADNHPDVAPNPPMKLLPNRMLERMLRESQGATQRVEFIVPGEVTDFRGENYLLLRKLMRKRDMGNLSR